MLGNPHNPFEKKLLEKKEAKSIVSKNNVLFNRLMGDIFKTLREFDNKLVNQRNLINNLNYEVGQSYRIQINFQGRRLDLKLSFSYRGCELLIDNKLIIKIPGMNRVGSVISFSKMPNVKEKIRESLKKD